MPALPSTRQKKVYYQQTFMIKQDYGGSEVTRHTLLINPEDMNVTEPAKVTVTETLGGGFISDFGSGFKTVVIQGITGYRAQKNVEGITRDGYTEFIHFRTEVYRKFLESEDPRYTMYWYNWEDDEYWRIQPTNFRLMRNKNEPLLYRYEFLFTLLQRVNSPAKLSIPSTGNPAGGPAITKAGTTLGDVMSTLSEALNAFKK